MHPSFPQSSAVRIFLPILIFLFIIIALFHEQLLAAAKYPSTHCSAAQPSTNLNPPLTPKVKTFRELPVLVDLSPAGDAAWAKAALTPGGGFLRVRSNETTVHGWGISMFHALHCLQTIRTIVRESTMMQEESGGGKHEKSMAHDHDGGHGSGHDMMDPEHVAHCIGYIAQHLLCAADSTIEPPWIRHDKAGKPVTGVDGVGYEHQCRDNSLLWNVATKSEQKAFPRWDWRQGDTVESVFPKERR
ncbi:hypothetical protein JMJ35_006912 [Cladonia borealis]|uniref:Uncharacterized protein n=1 Tax=Cladonia borealis TaxID=184061 RepID=A0AA39V7L0_9LECA|nr:hypothetical protein JMJ35_006912 [Cladonia borealis]